MSLKCFVLDNLPDRTALHDAVEQAVRDYLGDPALHVVYTDKGAPTLPDCDPPKYLSVTTTGEKMLVALQDSPVGIDGEYIPRVEQSKTDYLLLAERFFSGEETEYVRDGSSVGDEKLRFLKVWTRKEAYIKCAGKVLSDFPSFSVVENGKLLSKLGSVSLRKFSISFEGCENYLFAIAGV